MKTAPDGLEGALPLQAEGGGAGKKFLIFFKTGPTAPRQGYQLRSPDAGASLRRKGPWRVGRKKIFKSPRGGVRGFRKNNILL